MSPRISAYIASAASIFLAAVAWHLTATAKWEHALATHLAAAYCAFVAHTLYKLKRPPQQ